MQLPIDFNGVRVGFIIREADYIVGDWNYKEKRDRVNSIYILVKGSGFGMYVRSTTS